MKSIELNEQKQILVDILQNVHDFCKKNQINYSLAGGSLIGAIRHKGFIPWDDDIDILLHRDEYERFLQMYVDPSGIYQLHSMKNDPQYCYPFAKVEDTRTIINENVSGPKMGISIDVFPVDDLFDDRDKCLSYIKKSSLLS